MSGVVEGGWEFVIAAYAVTGAVLLAYATSVFLRYRTEQRRAAAEAEREARR
jgi:hypothetical protein